jgi:hypothetical protein
VKFPYALSLALLLCGCMMSTSPDALRQESSLAARVCSPVNLTETLDRIEAGWRRCHEQRRAPGAPIMSGGLVVGMTPASGQMFSVSREAAPVGGTVIVQDVRSGIVWLVADVAQTPVCRAEVAFRGANPVWRSVSRRSEVFLEQPSATCPFI